MTRELTTEDLARHEKLVDPAGRAQALRNASARRRLTNDERLELMVGPVPGMSPPPARQQGLEQRPRALRRNQQVDVARRAGPGRHMTAQVQRNGDGWTVPIVSGYRTARRLMAGAVIVPDRTITTMKEDNR